MTTHEIRFKGLLIEHMPEAEAHKYVAGRLAHPIEGPAFDPNDWTVQPRKPVELHGRGNLIDTFDTTADAEKARDAQVAELAKRHLRRGKRPADFAAGYTITDTREAPSEQTPSEDARTRPTPVPPKGQP